MDDATFVFELLLLKDYSFSHSLDEYIDSACTLCIINPKDVPYLVIKLIELLENKNIKYYLEHLLSIEETYKLFTLFRGYIISKIVCEFDSKEFNEIYNNCIRLAVSNLSFVKQKKKQGWICF
jgi:hypothetical protein